MSSDLIAITARHLERLLIVLAGGLSIVLGYRMFLAMPHASRGAGEGEGKIELPGGISIYVSRVGPAVFFALFGAVILGLGLHQGLDLEVREERPALRTEGDAAGGARSLATVTERRYSSAVPDETAAGPRQAERRNALGTVGQLARLAAALDGVGGKSLSPEQRVDFALALSDARMRLLAAAWDEQAWGPYAAFVRWVQDGEGGAPPARAEPAVRAFRGGR